MSPNPLHLALSPSTLLRRRSIFESLETRRLLSVSGAIFTTDSLCETVNGNIYDSKEAVYLNGGPHHTGAAGLTPGDYYVKVTAPDGTLLGTSVGTPNPKPVHVGDDGEFELDGEPGHDTDDCLQLWSCLDSDNNGTIDGYLDTPNNGGEYKVWISLVSDFDPSESKTDNFKVRSSTSESEAFLYGIKFEDHNGNGAQDDPDDDVLADWVIYLDDNANDALNWTDGNANKLWDSGEGEQWTTTSTLGLYSFSVTAGDSVNYRVREAGLLDSNGDIIPLASSGWIQTTTNPDAITSIAAGDTVHAGDFGNFQLGTLSGHKFEDLNGDGINNDGATGLAGWTIILDDDGDGIVNGTEVSTTTGAGGLYTFTNVGPGSHTVTEVQQSGWTNTYSPTVPFDVYSGDVIEDLDFGNFENVCISGHKFEDLNGDRTNNDGATGLAGWVIILDDNGNGAVDTGETWTTTGTGGYYKFSDVGPGSHTVTEVEQSGWKNTYVPSNPFNVTSGTNVKDLDFGNFKLGVICGQKFNDCDTDGIKDYGESRLDGWRIFIDINNDGKWDADGIDNTANTSDDELSVLTSSGGNYKFSGLFLGTYIIREVNQSGWVQTTTNPAAITITTSGTKVSDVDFGNVKLGAGGGYTLGFWSNKNGQKILTGSTTGKNLYTNYLNLLNTLNLKKANGTDFVLPATNNYALLNSWLLSANATNMAYMLSAQLATMALNVATGSVNGNALLYAPALKALVIPSAYAGAGLKDGLNSTGFIKVNDLIALGNKALGLTGGNNTVATSFLRTYEDVIKTALDNGNNNLTFALCC